MIWIDYLAQSPSPPSIATVIPVPINPKLLWDQKKNRGGQEELERAEKIAQEAVESYEEACIRVSVDPDEGLISDTDLSEVCGELSRALHVSKSDKRKKKSEKRSVSYATRTEVQLVISALSNMKAAANFMLTKKIGSGAIHVSNKSYKDLTYEKLFQRKVVTPEDVQFYEQRSSTDSILKIIDDAILSAPMFEWLPTVVLSEEQLLAKQRMLLQQTNQAAAVRRLCDQLLLRERERMQGETVERLTNQAQVRNEQRELARVQREQEKEQMAIDKAVAKAKKAEEKAAEKAAEKDRKAAEKEQKKRQQLELVAGIIINIILLFIQCFRLTLLCL